MTPAECLDRLASLVPPERPRPDLLPGDTEAIAWAVAEIAKLSRDNARIWNAGCDLELVCRTIERDPCVAASYQDQASDALKAWALVARGEV